jgi:uncharacterized protein involved in type VI secretion and phage assembly
MSMELLPFDPQVDLRLSSGLGGLFYGVYPALVTDVKDPDGQGRVKVKLPWSPDTGSDTFEVWARLTTMMGGKNRGSWFIPDVDDEVLLVFEAGDAHRPYVIGGLWNGRDQPPESMDGGGRNYRKVIQSRNRVKITLDDQDGQEKLILETPGGQKVTLKDGPGVVEVADSNGNSLKMEAGGLTIVAAARMTIRAPTIEINGSLITANVPTATFSGMVQSQTLISTTVVGTTYTPGAGNIW